MVGAICRCVEAVGEATPGAVVTSDASGKWGAVYNAVPSDSHWSGLAYLLAAASLSSAHRNRHNHLGA